MLLRLLPHLAFRPDAYVLADAVLVEREPGFQFGGAREPPSRPDVLVAFAAHGAFLHDTEVWSSLIASQGRPRRYQRDSVRAHEYSSEMIQRLDVRIMRPFRGSSGC